jgi:1,4-alpha-glucan branching enzyme
MTVKDSMNKIFYGFSLFIIIFCCGCSLRHLGPHAEEGGVRFSIKAPGAKKVMIAGSFNHWDTERDSLSGPDDEGIWTIILPVTGGRYEYLFLIDGETWVLDPEVPFIDDGLGGRNSVFVLRTS